MISIRKFCPYFFSLLILILWLYFFWCGTFRKMFKWRYIRFAPLTHFSHANNFRIGTQRSNTWYLRLSEGEKKYFLSKSEQQQEENTKSNCNFLCCTCKFCEANFYLLLRSFSFPFPVLLNIYCKWEENYGEVIK